MNSESLYGEWEKLPTFKYVDDEADRLLFPEAPKKYDFFPIFVLFYNMLSVPNLLNYAESLQNGILFGTVCALFTALVTQLCFYLLIKTLKLGSFSSLIQLLTSIPQRFVSIISFYCLVISVLLTLSGMINLFINLFDSFFSSFLSTVNLSVLWKFLGIVLISIVGLISVLYMRNLTQMISISIISFLFSVATVAYAIACLVYAKSQSSEVVPTSRSILFPLSFRQFCKSSCFTPAFFLLPNFIYGISDLRTGTYSRCKLMSTCSLASSFGINTLFGVLMAIALKNNDIFSFFNKGFLPSRFAELIFILAIICCLPLYMYPLKGFSSVIKSHFSKPYFSRSNHITTNEKSPRICALLLAFSILFSFWNFGTKVLYVLNSSFFLPFCMFIIPVILYFNELESRKLKDNAFGIFCIIYTAFHFIFGCARFAYL